MLSPNKLSFNLNTNFFFVTGGFNIAKDATHVINVAQFLIYLEQKASY